MDERALFLDDYHIGKMEGLERRAHRAERYSGNPLITREYPWEQARCQVYGRCVVYNSERDLCQMYYLAMPRGEHYPNVRIGGVTKPASSTFPRVGRKRRRHRVEEEHALRRLLRR